MLPIICDMCKKNTAVYVVRDMSNDRKIKSEKHVCFECYHKLSDDEKEKAHPFLS